MTYPQPRALIGPLPLFNIYRRRLRAQRVQESLAGLGVAIAVALVLATLVANASIANSASEVVHTVTGPANLQLRSLRSEGFNEALVRRVEGLPGIKRAAPLLEATATIRGRRGHSAIVTVVGADISLAILDGLAHTLPISTLGPSSVGLSSTSAQAIGIRGAVRHAPEAHVELLLRGTASQLKLATVLGPEAVGPIARAFVVVMNLTELQRVARLRGRVSRILVQTAPSDESRVAGELRSLVKGGVAVARADQDIALLRQALRPSDQASTLFAVIATLLGFLFAFNALLLTAPERRRAIADFRLGGARPSVIVEMVLFQAVCLGFAASALGALAGYLLATAVFQQTPAYLAQAFTLSSATVVTAEPVVLATVGGVTATCFASALPLLDLRRARAVDAVYYEDGEPGNWLSRRTRCRSALASVVLLATATALFAMRPSLALPAAVLLALASVLAVPSVFAATLAAGGALVSRFDHLTSLSLALRAMRATALRSLALVATGTVALFGAVSLGGSRGDLLRGIEGYIRGFIAPRSIWIVNPGDPTAVDALPASDATLAARVSGVSEVRIYRNTYLDLGKRRVWILVRPPGTTRALLEGQIIRGSVPVAVRRIESGGWITLSSQLAAERHVSVGSSVFLPTPNGPMPFEVAALTTNLTWSPGAIVISARAYNRAWGSAAPTAVEARLNHGASPAAVMAAIRRHLGYARGIEVLTSGARARRTISVGREGLGQLAEISNLLVIAAILAMAAALTSAIWQRRSSFAGLRLSGVRPSRLRRIMLIETTLMIVTGCVVGVIGGTYGQLIIDAYLRHVTGFPVASAFGGAYAAEVFAVVVGVALAIAAAPTWLAANVPPTLALRSD